MIRSDVVRVADVQTLHPIRVTRRVHYEFTADRPIYRVDPERLERVCFPGRGRPAVQCPQNQSGRWRPEETGVLENLSQRPYSGDRGSRQWRFSRVRDRSDSAVPGEEDRQAHAEGRKGRVASDSMADVPDGWHRTDDGSGECLLPLLPGKAAVCYSALSQRMPPAIRGAGWAAQGQRIPVRRL